MAQGRHHRSLLNIKLTRRFHFRYFGAWIILTVMLIVAMNALAFILVEMGWQDVTVLNAKALSRYLWVRQTLLPTAILATLLGGLATVLLAMVTAHRIAGPYIRLKMALREVTEGNMRYRLKFRKYDHLEDVEEAFNTMMEALRTRMPGTEPVEAGAETRADGDR